MTKLRPEESLICVNGIWRSSSTYVWSKFRLNEAYCCYLEPLHEHLLDITAVEQSTANAYAFSRHPDLARPYFFEYPLNAGGGVPFYQARFAYENWILKSDEADEPLRAYFENLIAHAKTQRKRAMIQPNRMLFRGRWLTQQVSTFHIFLVRNPADIWASMTSFENFYFPEKIALIYSLNSGQSLFARVAQELSIPEWRPGEHDIFRRFILDHERVLEQAFYYLFLSSCLFNFQFTDMILDVSALSSDPSIARSVRTDFGEASISVEMNDCNAPAHSATPNSAAIDWAIERLRAHTWLHLSSSRVEWALAHLSPELRRLIERLA